MEDRTGDSDSEEEILTKTKNKRHNNILESSESEEECNNVDKSREIPSEEEADSSPLKDKEVIKSKTRIIKQLDSDSDESTDIHKNSQLNDGINNHNNDSSSEDEHDTTNYSLSKRIKDRRDKFDGKFQQMFSKTKKVLKENDEVQKNDINIENEKSSMAGLIDSESSDDEKPDDKRNSVERCEENDEENIPSPSPTFNKKHNNIHMPKAQRMSAKQATEQMKKIKSESSRMLREKQVCLPYHKPKQMSLKDILAKRKANPTLGNSRLGFKMNASQLTEYAKELEKREKEILELCKSESEEEEEEEEKVDSTEQDDKNKIEELQNDKSNDGETEDFASLKKACKNLLDIFDKDEQPAVKKSTALIDDHGAAAGDDCEKSDNITSNETLKSNLVSDNETTEDDSFTLTNNNSEQNASETISSADVQDGCSNIVNFDKDSTTLVDNSNISSNLVDDEVKFVDRHDKENGADSSLTNNTSENETNNKDSPDEISNNGLPDSELLFDDDDDDNDHDMDCDFKIDDIVKVGDNKNVNKNKMIIDDDIQIDASIEPKAGSSTQIEETHLRVPSQSISCSAPLPNRQPKLTGSPGCFIDLISGEVKSGVELLKKKFMFHSAIKSKEEMERVKERKIHPGSALQKFKRDLEDKIIDHRTQEWTKRLEVLAQKKSEENDQLSDCEELLEKEELKKNVDGINKVDSEMDGDESCDEEEELEENDVDLTKEKKKTKCDLLDEEAEVDDEADVVVSADEKEGESDYDGEDSESSDDSGDDLATDVNKKALTRILKPFDDSDSSGDENGEEEIHKSDENSESKTETVCLDTLNVVEKDLVVDLATPIKENSFAISNTSDFFESQSATKNNSFSFEWDDMPLGQRINQTGTTPTPSSAKRPSNISLTETKTSSSGGRSNLASLVSPIIKLTGMPRISSDNNHSEELTESPSKCNFQYENEKLNNLQKKLLFDSEGSQCTQDLQDLESLCSGRFPTQESNSESSSKPSDLDKLIGDSKSEESQSNELSQDLESELLGLCTGKFAGINDAPSQASTTRPIGDSQSIILSLSETQNTESLNNMIENIMNNATSGPWDSCNSTKVSGEINATTAEGTPRKTKSDSSEISREKVKDNDNREIDEKKEGNREELETAVCSRSGKLAFLSSDDDEEISCETGDKTKVLKSKKDRNNKSKKKFHLQFSDDESEKEEEIEDDLDTENVVDYDSEENEIQVQPEEIGKKKNIKKKKMSEFFDQEAELTSEDEWIGSGDEDERGMDRMEWEEGDADNLDERKVQKQLERIHLRTMLDDDKREVRLLQEMLLEDDMEGGTRERKFRWRNVDSTIEVGTAVGDDDVDCGTEDVQTEEEWRKQRHQRETYLRQLMEKENAVELSQFSQDSKEGSLKIISRTSFTSTILKRKSLSLSNIGIPINDVKLAENNLNGENEVDAENVEKNQKKLTKDLPSPVKKPFAFLKNHIRGSFLSRGQAAMNRLAMLTKNAPQPSEGEPTNLSSLAPGKKKNFVFATVSPPCNKNNLPEDVKMAKRKATSEMSTPALIKKTRLIEKVSARTRSLIDHIE